MAFYNRIGGLMRQTISQSSVSNGQVTGPSMFNVVRYMSSKLFVGGLSYQTDDDSLKEAFSGFGDVVEVACVLCLVGSITIVLHAPHETRVSSVKQVWFFATEPGCLNLKKNKNKIRMAFYNRIGGLMRQTISQSSVSNGQVTGPSMFNAVRYMSSKLFVGGLSYQTDDHSLKEAFSGFGDVVEARVVTDRESGRSRGFGFVNYSCEDSANEAMKAMDGQAKLIKELVKIYERRILRLSL